MLRGLTFPYNNKKSIINSINYLIFLSMQNQLHSICKLYCRWACSTQGALHICSSECTRETAVKCNQGT